MVNAPLISGPNGGVGKISKINTFNGGKGDFVWILPKENKVPLLKFNSPLVSHDLDPIIGYLKHIRTDYDTLGFFLNPLATHPQKHTSQLTMLTNTHIRYIRLDIRHLENQDIFLRAGLIFGLVSNAAIK